MVSLNVEYNSENGILPVDFNKFVNDNNIEVGASLIEEDEEYDRFVYINTVKYTYFLVKSMLNSVESSDLDKSITIDENALDYILEMVLYNEEDFYLGRLGAVAVGLKVSALNNNRLEANFEDVLEGIEIEGRMNDIGVDLDKTQLNRINLVIIDIILNIVSEFNKQITFETAADLSILACKQFTMMELIGIVYNLIEMADDRGSELIIMDDLGNLFE